jgi:hypothetical protein
MHSRIYVHRLAEQEAQGRLDGSQGSEGHEWQNLLLRPTSVRSNAAHSNCFVTQGSTAAPGRRCSREESALRCWLTSFATAHREPLMSADQRQIDVARVRITDAGRRALG